MVSVSLALCSERPSSLLGLSAVTDTTTPFGTSPYRRRKGETMHKAARNIIVIVLIGLGAAGCVKAGFSRPWLAAEYEFAREYLECATPVQEAPPPLPSARSARAADANQIQIDSSSRRPAKVARVPRDLVFMCMRAKGWVLRRGGDFRP